LNCLFNYFFFNLCRSISPAHAYKLIALTKDITRPTTILAKELPENKVSLIENFVPNAVRRRMEDRAHGKWMCDLRRVTVLFINLKGLKSDDSTYLMRLQVCF
jgi:hypothetical protein